MLPLWRNQLRVVLCPDKVIFLGWGRGLHPKVILQTTLPCAPISDVPNWQSALDVFECWLGSHEMGRADVTVVLSNHFVRYAVMPYSIDVNSREEERTLAQILFEGVYGELVKQWKLEIVDGGYGEPRLMAAADTSLLDKIANVLTPSTLQLSAITPYFVSAFNRFHKQMQEPDGLFTVVEAGQMVVVAFKNAQLSSVRRVLLNGKLDEHLPKLLQREALTSGLDMNAVPIYLHVVGRPDFKLPDAGGLIIHVLSSVDSFVEDTRFDMATV